MRANITLGRGEQTTSSGVTNYNFSFPVESADAVALYLNSTRLNYGFDFTISGAGVDTGFTVSLTADPGDAGTLIALLEVPLSQTMDLIYGGAIPGETLEDKLDYIVQCMQMFDERYRRTIRLAPYSLDEDIIAPDYVADKWWKYDATTRKIVLADPPSGAPGLQGPAGPGILFGSGAPSSGLGSINATYIDTASFDVYSKTAVATWTLQGNIKGGKGDPGDDGVSTTVGAARGQLSVANADFAAGDLTVTVDLTDFALANANFAIVPIASWVTDFLPSSKTTTSVVFEWTQDAPSDGVIDFVLVVQGDITGSGSGDFVAHDHTENTGDGGPLTREVHDAYSEYYAFSDSSVGTVPAGKSRIWYNGTQWLQKVVSTVLPLGYFAHSHSSATADGGTQTSPQIENYIDLKQIAAPTSPASTYHRIYRDSSDGHLKIKNNAGTVVDLEAAASGTNIGAYGVRGLLGNNNLATPNTQFDFTADAWILRSAAGQIVIRTPVTSKTLNIANSGPNGRDQSGAFAASNWIYVYGIDNGVTQALIASLTAPPTGPSLTLAAGYTHWNFLTALRINSSGNIVNSRVRGPQVFFSTPQNILTAGSATSATSVTISAFVPPKALTFDLLATMRPLVTVSEPDLNIILSIQLVSGTNYRTIQPEAGSGLANRGEREIIAPYTATSILYALSDNSSANGSPRVDLDITGYSVPNDG
jgi:hypothetical protein